MHTSGLAFESVNGVVVEPRRQDGNHVVASGHPRPWTRQMNLLLAYLYFFNPLRFLIALVRPLTTIPLADTAPAPSGRPVGSPLHTFRRRVLRKLRAHLADAVIQLIGMWGLARTIRRTWGWSFHLMRGGIKRRTAPPASRIPMRSADGGPASHALRETPD